jgi:ABC-2 type transport system permease protein
MGLARQQWLKAFAENQPVTQDIEAIRAYLIGTPVGNHAWLAVIWCTGLLLAFIPLTAYLFRKYSSK